MKRLVSFLCAAVLALAAACTNAGAVIAPNDEVLFTSDTVQGAIEEIESRFNIKITDKTRNGVTMETLHNLETALNLLSFDLFQETVNHFSTRYGIKVEIIFSRYTGQDYVGLTSLLRGVRKSCSIELVDTGRLYSSSGLDVDTMVHELSHLINYAMLGRRDENPVEPVFTSINDGLYYEDTYPRNLNLQPTAWARYLASLGDTVDHYFVNDYAMTDVYEDFASLFELLSTDSDTWEAALLRPENAPLMAKYRGAVSLLDQYFTSGSASPLGDLFPAAWAMEEWHSAKGLGLVPDGLDRQYDAPITRQEFCRLMVSLLSAVWGENALSCLSVQGYDLTQSVYPDCNDANVNALTALGVVNGWGDGSFAPYASITRQEAAKMLVLTARAADAGALTDTGHVSFSDSGQFPDWSAEYIDIIAAAGVMNGTGGGAFSPLTTYDRQQSIITACRLYDCLTEG